MKCTDDCNCKFCVVSRFINNNKEKGNKVKIVLNRKDRPYKTK